MLMGNVTKMAVMMMHVSVSCREHDCDLVTAMIIMMMTNHADFDGVHDYDIYDGVWRL